MENYTKIRITSQTQNVKLQRLIFRAAHVSFFAYNFYSKLTQKVWTI